MVKLWLRWESVKRSCFALTKSPYSVLKNQWAHFGFHDGLHATALALVVTRLLCTHFVQGFPWPQLQHHLWVSDWTHSHNTPGIQTYIFIHIIQGLSSKNPCNSAAGCITSVCRQYAVLWQSRSLSSMLTFLTAPASHSLQGTACSIILGFVSGMKQPRFFNTGQFIETLLLSRCV